MAPRLITKQILLGLESRLGYPPTFATEDILSSGSSSFDLSNQVGEPLTGRKTILTLYPTSQLELLKQMNPFNLN